MPIPFRLIVFDLDGTLIDSRRDLAESANALIAVYGGKPLDESVVAGLVGASVGVWLPQALAQAGVTPAPPEAAERFMSIYESRLLNHTRAYAGATETIETLAPEAELAVLTNKLRGATVRILEGLGLARYLTHIAGADGPYPPKPAPGGLQAMMREAGAEPHETLLVGDSPIDWQTVRNAGARICMARYGYGFVENPPAGWTGDELFIDRLEELPGLLGIQAD